MNITEQSHVERLESDNADLRASLELLRAVCDWQRQVIAELEAGRADVPKLGILDASKRIPQP